MNTQEMESSILGNYQQQLVNQFDDKLKECCLVWGVNLEDHEEISRRCKIVEVEGEERKEVQIDGYTAMIYTDWKLDPVDLNKPLTMGASFQCSEIFKPINSNI